MSASNIEAERVEVEAPSIPTTAILMVESYNISLSFHDQCEQLLKGLKIEYISFYLHAGVGEKVNKPYKKVY